MKQRIGYIDAIRGFAIMTVVYMHLGTFAVGEDCTRFIFPDKAINYFFMPLFMFISGYFSAAISIGRIKDVLCVWKNKCLNILIPTIVSWSLWVLYTERDFWHCATLELKWGFWFTFVLFEIFIIYSLLRYFLSKLSITVQMFVLMLLIVILVISYRILDGSGFFDNIIIGLFSISQLFKYLPYFLFGVVAGTRKDLFVKLIDNKWFMSIGLFMFGMILVTGRAGLVAKFLGVLLIWGLFRHFGDYYASDERGSRWMRYVGSKTMQIYFLQYPIIWGMKSLAPFLRECSESGSWFIHTLIYLLLTFVVIEACLIVERLMQITPPYTAFCLGS